MAEELLIGGHVSASGGIPNALDNVNAIGGNVVQIFSASPRVWARKPIEQNVIDAYNTKQATLGIKATVIHSMYLINLVSPNPESVEKSKEVVRYDMNVGAKINAVGVVVHVGSHQGRGFDPVKTELVNTLSQIILTTPKESVFLIENSAGQNGKIGHPLEQIKFLVDELGSDRVGWCLDTCHAHAAGYRLAPGHASPFSTEPFLAEEIERLGLWKSLKVVHVNESRDPFFSHRDRHANLGEGEIGNEPLSKFLHNEHIRKLPLILEVPGKDNLGPDKENIEKLKALAA